MKKIDIYIIKKFLLTFFFMLAVIMAIAVVFDISEKLDDFLTSTATMKEIITEYYLNFVIYYSNLFSALLIFIAVIFFTSKMASRTEVIAMLSSGISFRRMLLPYFICATLLAMGSWYLNHTVIPSANKQRLAFEEAHMRNPYRNRDRDIHRQVAPGEQIYFESYNNERHTGYKFTYEKWKENVIAWKLSSNFIRWDSLKGKWTVENYVIRTVDGMKEKIIQGRLLDTLFAFRPDDFSKRLENIEMMNTTELDNFIAEETAKGSDLVPYYLIEKHQRTSYPFATYILVLIGVCIASRKVRGGIGLHIALGLLIAVTYILAMKVTTVYATNAGLNALTAVWIPNLMFAVLAGYLLTKAQK